MYKYISLYVCVSIYLYMYVCIYIYIYIYINLLVMFYWRSLSNNPLCFHFPKAKDSSMHSTIEYANLN